MTDFLETKESINKIFNFFSDWFTRYDIKEVQNGGIEEKLHDWGVTKLNEIFPLKEKTVIEMGPQEAAHTIMLHNFGAKKITSLEGRLSNYVKCCVIKNLYELHNVKFYLEDLRTVNLNKFGTYDVCLCSGLLYHLPNPQELITKIAEIAPRILINSHYANETFPSGDVTQVTINGNTYMGKNYVEGDLEHPNSGLQQLSFWLFKDDFIAILKNVGYDNVQVLKDWGLDTPKPKMAAITIYAEKSGRS